ncbi:MAG TPA: SCO family protein [Candidatus Limnocylindrales bacterium]|nr:SCO family protein [Candidatus Limnocylindrales bacterium]
MVRLFALLLLVALGLTVSCEKRPESPTTDNRASTQQVFQVKGLVVAVKPREKAVEIKHEEIPGYMPAMTMPFDVKDTNALAELEPGQRVSFRLLVTDTEGWIDHIQKLGEATNTLPTAGPVRLARNVDPLQGGDLLPDYRLVNQFGEEIHTSQFKGRALAITFLFTRCPYPTFCPLVANHFEEVQKKLLELTQAGTNWHLLTISFDPEFDKPEVLKVYAQSHHYDPKHWTFATGDLVDITAIGEQFGLAFWQDQNGSISHNLRTVVIDATGRVQKVFEGNTWTADELASEMVKAGGKT